MSGLERKRGPGGQRNSMDEAGMELWFPTLAAQGLGIHFRGGLD